VLAVVVENASASVFEESERPLPIVSAPTTPLPLVERIEFWMLETVRLVVDAVPEIVTLPVFDTEKSVVVALAVEDETRKTLELVSPLLAEMASLAHGVEVPMPMLPFVTGAEDIVAPL